MKTTPDTAALLSELFDRASIVVELDGPQIEAWVSGLFPVFDDEVALMAFVDHCVATKSEQGSLLVAAIAELAAGLDPTLAAHAEQQELEQLPPWASTIGTAKPTDAWSVTARFGRSIVLGFDSEPDAEHSSDTDVPGDTSLITDTDLTSEAGPGSDITGTSIDLRHSILAELDDRGVVVDLQLTGPAKMLVDEAADEAGRVEVAEMPIDEAIAALVAAWPTSDLSTATVGAGFDANQQFVRRRIMAASGHALGSVVIAQEPIDVRRGMSEADYADANRAALSTLQAAVGLPDKPQPDEPQPDEDVAGHVAAWASVVRGDVGDVAPRERDALLWLEWADWLGAGIGLFRAGAGTEVDGETLVDFVNRCPEVSSVIDKADREYAEWAFDVALDLLQDQGVITDDRRFSSAGYASLRHGLVAAWT